ncbi:MAG: hypothetical protein ACI8SE_000303 [Bacteroidia bacterium]|jgi:uncharacterized protein (TIGR01777 family)
MKVVIAGGRGFIGQFLVEKYIHLGHDVIVISRTKDILNGVTHISWEDVTELKNAINHADLLINMAGKSVDCRYHEKNKKAILTSRVQTTKKLGAIVETVEYPPKLWVNSSTATIYRHAEDRPMTESTGDIGSGFSVDVATQWEQAFFAGVTPNTRKVAIRTAIVLGRDGGAFKHFCMLTKIGFGGPQGNGSQMVSFIHIEDVFNGIEFIRKNTKLEGVFNLSAPNPVTNSDFMKTLREHLNVRFGVRIYAWMLSIGAFVLRTETELLLKSRWVMPERIEREGFMFKYPSLSKAIRNLLSGL